MKMKFRRVSKSTLSVILALMMVVSTMLIGTISVSAVISYWQVAGDFNGGDNWGSTLDNQAYRINGATGSITLDLNDKIGYNINFKMVAIEDGKEFWCGASSISMGNECSLSWGSGNPLSLKISKRYVTFTMSANNKLTVTESDSNGTGSSQYWVLNGSQNNGSLSWDRTAETYKINGTTGTVTYDTNNNKNQINFKFTLRNKVDDISGLYYAGTTSSGQQCTAGTSYPLNKDPGTGYSNWGIFSNEEYGNGGFSMMFTPTKRYVDFTISESNGTYSITVSERNDAETTYSITTSATTNGSIKVTDTNGNELTNLSGLANGTEFKVITQPDTNYVLDTLTVDGATKSGDIYKIDGKNVTIIATFKKDQTGGNGYVLMDKTNSLGTFTSKGNNTYELEVQLVAGTTYKLYVDDKNGTSADNRAPYYLNDTLYINSEKTLWRYKTVDGLSGDRVSFTPSETGTYKFTFTCDVNGTFEYNNSGTIKRKGAETGKLKVEKSGTPVAEKVVITSPPGTSLTEGDKTTLEAEVIGLATGVAENQLNYQWYKDGTAISGATSSNYAINSATSSNAGGYYCVVSTDLTGSNGGYNSVKSNTLYITVSGKGVYVSPDLTSGISSSGWNEITNNTNYEITKANGGTYTIAFSDKNGFNKDVTDMGFTFDNDSSKYVTLSTSSITYDETNFITYVIKANSGTKNLKITINANAKTIKATAEIDKSSFVDSVNTYDNKTETVRYYFAENSNSTNHSEANNGTGLRIAYWNNSYNLNDGTKYNQIAYVDVTQPLKLNSEGKIDDNGSNVIHVNTNAFAYHPSSGVSDNDSYNVYYVDLPVGATSFRFVSSNNSAIPTKSTMDGATFFGSLALNPNRIYCYSSSNNNNDNYCFGIPLDKSFWNNTAPTNNQVDRQTFKTNIVNYAVHDGDGGRSYKHDTLGITEFNSVLNGVWNSSYQHPLYFGYLDSTVSGSHNFKLWENLALRGGDERRYFASVQGLAGDTLGKVEGSDYGTLRLADDSGNNPLFDFSNTTTMGKIAYKKDTTNGQYFTNKNFPFNKSEFDGVTTYSYDSTTDYNRKFKVTNGDFEVEQEYQKGRLNAGTGGIGLAYMPFKQYDPIEYGFGQEFDIEFYMTPTGQIVTNSNQAQDITFNFSGDDDVWVYVDGVLALDLGGAHKISAGSINFSDMKVYYKSSAIDTSEINSEIFDTVHRNYIKTVDLKKLLAAYGVDFSNTDATKKHTLQMFYMERGSFESNMSINFNLPQSSGLNVTSIVDSSKVNKGFVNAAMDTANGDFFSYTVTNSLIGRTASALTAISDAVNGLNYSGVTTPVSSAKDTVSETDKANFPTDNIFYQSGYDVSRVFNDTTYKLNSGAQGSGSSNAYLNSLTQNSYTGVSDVVYEIKGSHIKSNDNQEVFKATGKTDSNGNFNLLFGQSAVFDSTILPNTMVKVGQSDDINSVNADGASITAGNSSRKVSDYYKTTYEVYDNGSKKVLSSENSSLNNANTVYASEVGGDGSIYFANYDSTDTQQKSVAMTVTYTNEIQVGSIKIEKKLSNNENTRDKFVFDVKFGNIFGGSQTFSDNYEFEYDVYDAANDEKLNSNPYVYNKNTGIIILAGQYAVITGVPVGTQYQITERASSGYALKEATGTYYDKGGYNPQNMTSIDKGVSGSINVVANDEADDVIQAEALFTNEPQALTITYKYYDREVKNGTVAHISSTPTSYTKTYASRSDFEDYINRDENDKITEFNMSGLINASSTGVTPQNVIDDYVIFTSQKQAVDLMSNLANNNYDQYVISAYNSGDNGNGAYHTNNIGRPVDGENWITYKKSDGTEATEGSDGVLNPSDAEYVTEVTVWLFNYPKKYDVTFYKANAETDLISGSESVLNGKASVDGKMVANVSNLRSAYYNQRFGGKSSHDDQNDNGMYLNDYNIPAYLGGEPNTAKKVGNYYFQYWVDANGAIISTDYQYFNRVTNTMNFYAVYAEQEYAGHGVTVTSNQNDIFYDSNGNKKARVNTMFNVYGLPDYAEIEKSAVVYVNTENLGNNELTAEQLATMREEINKLLAETTGSSVKGTVTVEVTCKANGFVYTTTTATNPGAADVPLTSKNRMQFSTTFSETALKNKNFFVFAGMYYDGAWEVSDNYVVCNGQEVFGTTSN